MTVCAHPEDAVFVS